MYIAKTCVEMSHIPSDLDKSCRQREPQIEVSRIRTGTVKKEKKIITVSLNVLVQENLIHGCSFSICIPKKSYV